MEIAARDLLLDCIGFPLRPFGELGGGLADEFGVEQGEGLRCGGGGHAAGTAFGTGGAVEQVEDRKAQITAGENVNAATAMVCGFGAHGPLIAQEGAGDFLGQWRAYAGAAALAVEFAAGE